MADSVFPLKSRVDEPEGEPTVVPFEDAAAVFETLSTETARDIVSALCSDPATPSELADRVDTSLQNVTYHLSNLTDAGVIEVVDTWYSSRGSEMDVYDVASDPVVVCVGDERDEETVSHLVGGSEGGSSSPIEHPAR